jgi:hypothetical protein
MPLMGGISVADVNRMRKRRTAAVALDLLIGALCLAAGLWPVTVAALALAVADWRRGPA